jgi:SET domain-containing protein
MTPSLNSLIIRHMLPWHASSPVRPTAVQFAGRSKAETGLFANAPIRKETWVLHAGAVLSSNAVDEEIRQFSKMWLRRGKNGVASYKALLVGVGRFINHHCEPNAQVSLLKLNRAAFDRPSS